MNYEKEFQESIDYLNSELALEAVKSDPYWPKWDSPWWHMLLLHEIGETKKIPKTLINTLVTSLNKIPVKYFPIHPGEMPEDIDPYREAPCHCQLGNVYQVLAAWGVNVDQELPWIRSWFLRYQMDDGGLNCDSDAYLSKDEIPSSMVGTIAAFEAILLYTPRDFTLEEKNFLEKGANFLMSRKLMLGSSTEYNAEERESAKDWMKLCFPRYYFYDVLRGLTALLKWAEIMQRPIPMECISEVVRHLKENFPDGIIKNERYCYDGIGTLLPTSNGEWKWQDDATFFPLLKTLSATNKASSFLTRQWQEVNKLLNMGFQNEH